jgi:hypothetical protein
MLVSLVGGALVNDRPVGDSLLETTTELEVFDWPEGYRART